MPWVAAVLGGIAAFFSGLAAFVSSPFAHVAGAVPADGAGLDPSLQNPYMVAHPPMLYLGYVTMSVPFAFAMAALITGRTDARWLVSVRRWTLVSWAALGTGMLLGAHWAYVEIGWGGYWAWDPVENAALMPWLAATAFLHSVIVQEKKGMLKVWNMVLVSAAFSLAVFGDFLTRSGVVQSVHSFVQSPVGPYLLGFVATVLAVSTALIIWRLPLLRADHRLESVISREATFLFNNLLLLALAFAVLWGVIFPILSEAVRGVRSTVSTPYYDFFLVIFGLPLLALTGIGPLIAWRRASPDSLIRTFRWPVVSALSGAALLWLLGLGSSIAGLTALSLCIFVTVTVGLEFARGTAARRALAGGSVPRALLDLVSRNRRRYGGYVVHLAIVILVVGVTASSAYSTVDVGAPRNGAVHAGRRLHAHEHGRLPAAGAQLHLRVRAAGRLARRDIARRPRARPARLRHGPGRKRGRHPKQPAVRHRPVLDPPGRRSRLVGRRQRQGAREPGGRAGLAGRRRLPARRADHPLAGSA